MPLCKDCKFFSPSELDDNQGGSCKLELPPWITPGAIDTPYVEDDDYCDLGKPK